MAAVPQTAYAFSDNVFSVTTPISSLRANQYEIRNQRGQPLTFGLAQAATLNGTPISSTPIFAATVLSEEWLGMTPYDTVSVFLQSNVSNAMCLGTVTGPSCTVTLGGGKASQTINFVPNLGSLQLAA